jgi:hypothetical protein
MNKVIKICLVAAALAFAAGCSTSTTKAPNQGLAPDSSVSNVSNNVGAGTHHQSHKHCKKHHCRHMHKDKLGAPEAPAKDTNK